MNGIRHMLRRTLSHLRHLGHHHGYGVHSPFAFEYINRVVYERLPYSVYRDVETAMPTRPTRHARRLGRLLLRIVNRTRPTVLVDIGPPHCIHEPYLRAGCRTMTRIAIAHISDLADTQPTPDMVFLHGSPADNRLAIDRLLPHLSPTAVLLMAHIGHTDDMHRLWQDLIARPQVSLTLELYDLGLAMFDPTKMKRNYIVNF